MRAILAALFLGWLSAAQAAPLVAPCTESGPTATECDPINNSNPMPIGAAPSASASAGITPVVSGSAEGSHVLKATPGNLYSVYASNQTGTSGFLMVLNATSAPSDGAVTPIDCVQLPGNATASINYGAGPPAVYSTGIVAVVSSGANCFTKTTGTITAFIHGDVK